MKRLYFIFALVFFALSSNAQSDIPGPTQPGNMINAGLMGGLGGSPIYLGYDIPMFKDISIGPEVRLQMWNGYADLGLIANGDYHFNRVLKIPEQYDFYAGVDFGVGFSFNDSFSAGLYLGLGVGGRYFWSDWGVNVEFSVANGFGGGRLGLTKKF